MKKIMFSDAYGLTAAVIQGTKTRTWRKIPHSVIESYNDLYEYDELVPQGTRDNDFRKFALAYAPYKVGEEVAVAQSYRHIYCQEPAERLSEEYSMWFLKQKGLTDSKAWKNKMFVKSDFMPHRIRIEKVRVERLQDISNEDCFAEGITTKIEGKLEVGNGYGWDTTIERLKRDTFLTPRAAYAELIDKISGKGTWKRNPWVYAFSFKLIK